MNVADQDVFTFPSESELKEPLGLQEVQRRIKDLVAVLSDFNKLRDKDRYAVFPSECIRLTLTLCSFSTCYNMKSKGKVVPMLN